MWVTKMEETIQVKKRLGHVSANFSIYHIQKVINHNHK